MKRFFSLLLIGLVLFPAGVSAAPAKEPVRERGLLITPLRQYLKANAGASAQSTFSVANLTDKPLNVTFSVQQFSVTDYVYNYQFESPKNDWLHLGLTSITLQPNQTQAVPYSIQVPPKSAPGGHYYTLFASANLSSQGVQNTIQAADLVYFTVNGALTHVSHLQSSSMPRVVFGRTIPFTLNAIDTGNEHVFVYVSGQLHGLFVRPPQTSSAHLLLPGAVRKLDGSISSPVLPGLYKATYGYKTDSGWVIQQSHLVLYIPPWSIALLLALLLLLGRFWPRLHRSKKPTTPVDSGDK
jgi:hypothetical protein